MQAPLIYVTSQVFKQMATVSRKHISTSSTLNQVQLRTRLKVVDNSVLGKEAEIVGRPAYTIHVYKKNRVGLLGDKLRIAIRGQPKKAILVGTAQKQRHGIPRFDTNNIVLIEENGMPSATKIRVPIPNVLRAKGKEVAKILPNATRFV